MNANPSGFSTKVSVMCHQISCYIVNKSVSSRVERLQSVSGKMSDDFPRKKQGIILSSLCQFPFSAIKHTKTLGLLHQSMTK